MVFAKNTILCFFIFFWIDFYFLIPAVIANIFNPIVEPAIPAGTPTNKAKAKIESTPLMGETKMRKSSRKFEFNSIKFLLSGLNNQDKN